MVGTIVISTFFTFFHYLFYVHPVISNYKKTHREGEIVAKFKNKKFFVLLVSQILFLLISMITLGFSPFTPSLIMSIFIFLFNSKVIVTNSGFYIDGKYMRWKKVLRVEEDEKQKMIIIMDYVGVEKPLLLKSKLNIGTLENQEEFKQLADMYIRMN